MRTLRTFICVGALSLCSCGDGLVGAGTGADDSDDEGPVGEGFSGYCMVTFTEDHEIVDSDFGKTVLSVKKGERFLLTNLPFSPKIVLLRDGNGVALELDATGLTRIEAPCTDEGASVSSARVALADVEVFADDTLQALVCTIKQYERAATENLYLEWIGYHEQEGVPGNLYTAELGGAFCEGVSSGVMWFPEITLGFVNYGSVPFEDLFWLQE